MATAVPALWIGALAWRYRDLAMDDAYIGFRYLANLLDGSGFVFNPGERVEGVTNGGWLLLLAPLSLLVGAPPLAAKLAAVGALVATCAAAVRLAVGLGQGRDAPILLPVLTAVSIACHAELVGFSLLGMESAALAAALLAIVHLARRADGRWVPALGTLAFTLHPEAGLVVPLGCLLAAGGMGRSLDGEPSRRFAVRTAASSLLGVALVTAVRWAYFGKPLPNTFAAKPAGTEGIVDRLWALASGETINLGTPFASPWWWGLVACGVCCPRRPVRRTRRARSFRIARGVDWVLLARAESQQPAPGSSRTVEP